MAADRNVGMSETDIAAEAEHLLKGLADELTRPRERECLACFVTRMLNEFGCDETLRFARRYRDQAAPRATALERRLGDRGGFCDCEIFLNAYSLEQRFWTPEREVESDDGYAEIIDAEPPDTTPPCAGVRRGSARPCGNWR